MPKQLENIIKQYKHWEIKKGLLGQKYPFFGLKLQEHGLDCFPELYESILQVDLVLWVRLLLKKNKVK